MELWDAYNKDGRLAGVDLVRGQPIPNGLYHIVSEVLVKHVDGSFLLMQRDWSKIGYPGFFETGAGGAVIKGETPYDGALRELREETGISANELTHIFTYNDMNHIFFYGYLCITDCDKASITLQKGETISYRWLSRDEFLQFIETDSCIPFQRKRWSLFIKKI